MSTTDANYTIYKSTALGYCSECWAETGWIQYGEYGQPLCVLCYSKKTRLISDNNTLNGSKKNE